jgi:hypothetical protein
MAVLRASSPSPQRTGSWLVLVASVGLFVPGGLFLYWVFHGFTTFQGALHDWLALAFIVDVFGTTGLLAVYFAKHPPGPYRWYWFLAASLLGTLWFGLAFYWWLNARGSRSESTI